MLAKFVVEIGTYKISIPYQECYINALSGRFPVRGLDGEAERRIESVRPSGLEYTYALRLTFVSTNNEAEYEALLAGLRIAQEKNKGCQA
ncbi:reverse transcriptase domain-containing protein [Tanacetum coccineum]|uniref:Reverse transcriptase domain-containing protein n=1 Tax=Tanacetum coccineum TaxID=301880 RepID=A0ABQ5FYS8_9ASTR